jgi:hypothetical protein
MMRPFLPDFFHGEYEGAQRFIFTVHREWYVADRSGRRYTFEPCSSISSTCEHRIAALQMTTNGWHAGIAAE